MRRLLIVFGFFVLLGCDSKLVTVVLAPSQVATAVNRDYDFDKDTGVSCAAQREDFSCYGHYGVCRTQRVPNQSRSGYYTTMLMRSSNYWALSRQAAAASVSIAFTAACLRST